jgi:hypothetical protein
MIDPTLALQTQQPNTAQLLSQFTNLRGAQQNQQMQAQQAQQTQQLDQQKIQGNQLSLNQATQQSQDAADVRAATAGATDPNTGQVDRLQLLSTLGKLNPNAAAQTAQGFKTQDVAAQQAQAKLTEAQTTAVQTHLELKDKLLQGVTDQATYTNARNIALQNGFNPAEMPQQYDPQFVAQAHAQTLSQKDAFAQQQSQQATALASQKEAETVRHDQADEKNAATATAQTGQYQRGELANEHQKISISQGNPQLAAQLLVNGDATLSELKARGSTPEFIAKTLDAAHQLSGGKYNSQAADAQFSVAKSPANTAFFGSAKSLTDPGGTLDQLADAAKQIPGGKVPAFNSIADWEKAATGSGPIAKYASLALGVADDYSKVMGGGQGSDSSRLSALHLVDPSQSPDQRAGSISGIRGAVGSQTNSRIGANPIMKRMYGSETPSASSSSATSVTAPNGKTYNFPDAASAAAFKQKAGIQ